MRTCRGFDGICVEAFFFFFFFTSANEVTSSLMFVYKSAGSHQLNLPLSILILIAMQLFALYITNSDVMLSRVVDLHLIEESEVDLLSGCSLQMQ